MVVLAEGEVVADGPAAEVVVALAGRSPRRSPRSSPPTAWLTVAEAAGPLAGSAAHAVSAAARCCAALALADRWRGPCWPRGVRLAAVAAAARVGHGDANLAHAPTRRGCSSLLLPLLLAIVVAEIAEGRVDAKGVALLGVLAALRRARCACRAAWPGSSRCSSC